MKQKFPSPITQYNFEEVWMLTDQERRTAKKKYITSRIASFFSNMVFAFLTLIVSNGLIHDYMTGSYGGFLETVPYFLPAWEKFAAMVLKPEMSVPVQIAVILLIVYGTCFLVCGFFVLLVAALYHPLKRKLPTGTVKENADQLLAAAKDARRYANRSGAGGSAGWAFVFLMFQFCIIALYWLTGVSIDSMLTIYTAPVMNLLEPYLGSMPNFELLASSLFMPCLMVFCLMIYLGYAFANLLHALSVQFMYKYHVPYSFVAEVEYYYVFADENTAGFTAEEILQQRRDQAEAKRMEALELERIGARGKARQLLAEAAHGGDIPAMEHYARHWLIGNIKDPARFWLQRCVDSGEASESAVKTLRRLKWHLKIHAKYLT